MANLRDVIGKVTDTYGDHIIAQGSRGKGFRTRRVQSMIFDVDAVVNGGYPRGRFVLAYGPPSGGKSVLLYKAMGGMQQYCRYCGDLFRVNEHGEETCLCPEVCPDCDTPYEFVPYDGPPATENDPFDWELVHDDWVCKCLVQPKGTKAKKDRKPKITNRCSPCRAVLFDVERSYDPVWTAALGVDPDLLFVFVPEYAEQGADIVDVMIRSGMVDFVGVDSLAEMVPSKEIETSTEEWQVGLQARLVNKAFRKWSASMNSFGVHTQNLPLIFVVNQIRESMKGETLPAGWMQRFKSSIMLRVNAGRYHFKESGTGANKIRETQYADVSGFTKKNKTGVPMRQFNFRLYMSPIGEHTTGSTDEYGVVRERAIEYGIIEKDSSKSAVKYVYGEHVWSTKKAIIESMRQSHELFWEIRDAAMVLAAAETS